MNQIKILLIEDDEEDFELFEDYLNEIDSREFDITWANSYKKAIEILQSEQNVFDIYIVDYLLGAYSGLDVCKIIKSANDSAPIILLTGKGNREIDNKASDMGISDFIVKSEINAIHLERSIRYSIKQAEILSALKVSESKYKAVLKQSKDIIFIADLSFNILSISDSVANSTGYAIAEVKKFRLLDLIIEEDKRQIIEKAILNQKSVYNLQFSLLNKSNEVRTAVITCNFQESYPYAEFVHGVIIDKTEEIKAEQSRLVFEKLDATARFMRTLAHEVRNPLSNIFLALEGMESEADPEDSSPYFPIIKRNSYRIDDIITKVLNSSQIEHKMFSKGNVVEQTKQVLKTIEDKIHLKGIKLITSFPEEDIVINLNEEQFALAISNILVNAVEALDGVAEAIIEVKISDNKIYIIDNGPGISKADQSLIFEPYFTKKSNGIGLGLASCINILKLHKIVLELDSDTGAGAAFILNLPSL
ncbi:hybrid sensor histidine kinase/response regulator [Lacihabitans lacunae]|uniref:histidine kinase n=1 Tax=Lacihabitans lacunae TaxID=1028214 RepID=A0ABV7YTD5_9BACT